MLSILLVKTSSLGDVIHNLPVVSDIQRADPRAQVDWLVEEAFADIPRMHPGVRHTIPVALRRWRKAPLARATWREIAALRRRLEAEQYDLVIDTQGLIKSALLVTLAHGVRCGYAAEAAREPLAARFYDRNYAIPRGLHAVLRNRWLAAAAMELPPPEGEPDYGIAAPPLAVAWLPRRPYVVLLTATSRDDKLWPEPHWLALAARLAAQGYAFVLPSGSTTERERAARLAAQMPDAVAAPPLSIAELAGLMAGAAAVVGVDTGLTHLAAALARPTVALFGASDPLLTGVHAGARALNLGTRGAPPQPDAVTAALGEALPA